MPKLFINYRRDDSQYQADRLRDLVKPWVDDPTHDIFIDVDNIPYGVDFIEHLDGKVKQCDALIVMIGEDWLRLTDPRSGGRRLDNPDDFVRIEIESALNRDIPVVPVLLDGVDMPAPADLPDSLKPLARRNAVRISRLSFEDDVHRLMRSLPIGFKDPGSSGGKNRGPLMMLLGALVLAGMGIAMWGFSASVQSDTAPIARSPATIAASSGSSPALAVTPRAYRSGEVFSDTFSGGGTGPEMVVIPAGRFQMGSPASEAGRGADARPLRTVELGSAFGVGKYEVTWSEWDACVSDGGCHAAGSDRGWGKGTRPVINVDWDDAQSYVVWLSGKTGETYRLLSEAEWEYVARAGTTSAFSFGGTITPSQANYDGNATYNGGRKGTYHHEKTMPVGSYPGNGFGLYDMHGNVWEWTADCWNGSYTDAPTDGSVWSSGDCSRRVVRGGSWAGYPQELRSDYRNWIVSSNRGLNIGFRVARTL